jgi:hypothetical protein
MKSRKILDEVVGRFQVLVEMTEGASGLHDYGLPRTAWMRAVRLMNHYGSEKALDVIDDRANRAAARGDHETAKRWRTLITAIHAIENDEPLVSDNKH